MTDDTPTGKRGFDTETERLSYDLAQTRREVSELRETVEAQAERIAELEQVVSPNPGASDYEDLTRGEKVFRLRKALVIKAAKNGGSAAMDYEAVRSAFDYHPSVGHAYDLMAYAGQADGFTYKDRRGGKRLIAETDGVNDDTLVHAVNKTLAEGPA